MKKINVGVVGAAGYSGEELLRLLFNHQFVEIKVITSRKYAGDHIGEVFPRFMEQSIKFSEPNVANIINECDVVFLALPHGLAAEYAKPFIEAGLKVIDISADFRLRSLEKYKEYYGCDHPAPELLSQAVYGLPEHYRNDIKESSLIASAGCYPTSILTPSIPLLKAGIVSSKNIIASSMSGVSGAGRKVAVDYIYPECNESARAYATTGHRHLPEIEQELAVAAGLDNIVINFIPHLVPLNRGINSTIIYDATRECSAEEVHSILSATYADEAFVRILPLGKQADIKHVSFTNICEIGVSYDARTKKIIITSVIDNLTKGASGQAVQSMNIIFNLNEKEGLL